MHFNEWHVSFDFNFSEDCSWGSNWQQVGIGSGNGLVPNRRQDLTWTKADLVQRRLYAVFWGNELRVYETYFEFLWSCWKLKTSFAEDKGVLHCGISLRAQIFNSNLTKPSCPTILKSCTKYGNISTALFAQFCNNWARQWIYWCDSRFMKLTWIAVHSMHQIVSPIDQGHAV